MAAHSVLLPPEPQEGGLILIKPGMRRNPETEAGVEFKMPFPVDDKPRVSLLGLDRLAAAKKREKQLLQHKADEEPTSKRSKVPVEDSSGASQPGGDLKDKMKHYRNREETSSSATPTPSHRLYHQDLKEAKGSDKSKGIFATSNKSENKGKRPHQHSWETPRDSSERQGSDARRHTPYLRRHGGDETPSRSSWDDEMRSGGSGNKSSWDANTPRPTRAGDSTPAPTPAHRYNKWADDRKRTGTTPATAKRGRGVDSLDSAEYEEDQRRLDREWYGMDESEGFDQENNSFAAMSENFLSTKQVGLGLNHRAVDVMTCLHRFVSRTAKPGEEVAAQNQPS